MGHEESTKEPRLLNDILYLLIPLIAHHLWILPNAIITFTSKLKESGRMAFIYKESSNHGSSAGVVITLTKYKKLKRFALVKVKDWDDTK